MRGSPGAPAGFWAALMRYQILGQLRKLSGRVVVEIDAPSPIGTGAELTGNIVGRAELTNTGKTVTVRGRIAGGAALHCSRCLREFPWRFDISFVELGALRQIDDPEQYQLAEDEEEAIPLLDAEMVDLTELVRQLIAVEVPYRPLCRPDCAGLCPRCGADRNEGQCGCDDETIDPR